MFSGLFLPTTACRGKSRRDYLKSVDDAALQPHLTPRFLSCPRYEKREVLRCTQASHADDAFDLRCCHADDASV